MPGSTQLVMPGGEPRFTKVRGQNRYYDHALGRTISHRAYWKLRGTVKTQDKWTPEKAAKLKSPPTVKAAAPQPSQARAEGTPSKLAQQLLEDSMLGSPAVSTPPPPRGAAIDIAQELAEDTKKTVESLAETITPVLAMAVIILCYLLVPEHLAFISPSQEEAELVLEPAARIILRTLGITGKAMGPDGADILSIFAAMSVYLLGVKTRMDEYAEEYGSGEPEPEPVTPASAGRRGNSQQGRADTTPPAYANGASQSSDAGIFGRHTQQTNESPSRQVSPRYGGVGPAPSTERQAREAASIRDLFAADYMGRQRMGLAR